MNAYPALIDGEPGAFGVVFPDIDGIGAMGETVKEALSNAMAALVAYSIETQRDGTEVATPSPWDSVEVPDGAQLTTVPLHFAPTTT